MSLEEPPKLIHLFGLQNSLGDNHETRRRGIKKEGFGRFNIAQERFPADLAAGNSSISLHAFVAKLNAPWLAQYWTFCELALGGKQIHLSGSDPCPGHSQKQWRKRRSHWALAGDYHQNTGEQEQHPNCQNQLQHPAPIC